MNKKGFTLIELLVTIVIMALILIMVVPSITALQNNNKDKPYEYYADSLIEAAKIYVRKEDEDITPLGIKEWSGCVDISYQELLAADLIKPYSDEQYDCTDAIVRYTREENASSYQYNLTCLDTTDHTISFTEQMFTLNTCTVQPME